MSQFYRGPWIACANGAAVGRRAGGREELVARGVLEQLTFARLEGRQGVGVEADNDGNDVGPSFRRDVLAPGEPRSR